MRRRAVASLLGVLALSTGVSCFLDPDIQRTPVPAAAGAAGAKTVPLTGGAGGDPTVDVCSTEAACAGFRTVDGVVTPAAIPDAPTATGAPLVLAIEQVWVGDTDRDGNASDQAWKAYGFDLDGWNSAPGQGFH